ncbi:MAG: YihY/virulence factor BrkB family protein [Planctomycetes bacterium]|nr:YihY/virulence factor BrkB family protein [Planctomycetota bacterium]
MPIFKKILSVPTERVGRASRFAINQLKLWSHCARLLKKNHAGQQAAALSYHTIFGIVPLAIVMLLIFQSFPASTYVSQKIKDMTYKQLHLSTITVEQADGKMMLTEYLDQIVEKFFTGLNKGSITIFGCIIVIWAALALLMTIEKSFNSIWHVGKGRNFLQRTINYWALLTLGPLLLGAGIYVSTRHASIGQLQQTILSHTAPAVLSYLVTTIAFFFLYFVLPNTKVNAKSAIWGAAIAALVWALAKWGFGIYVVKFIPYSQIYGVMGLVPLGVLWIFISWIIVLFGLQLTFTTQHLKTLDAAEIASAKKTEDYFIANDFTVINIVREIAGAFRKNQTPVSQGVICSKLNLPAEFGEKILNHLVNREILVKVSEPKIGFMPAKESANIKLSDISEIVGEISFSVSAEKNGILEQINQSQRNELAKYNINQILSEE